MLKHWTPFLLVGLLVCLCPRLTLPQAPPPAPPPAPLPAPAAKFAPSKPEVDFANEPFVVEEAAYLSSFNPDGTGFRDQTFVVRIQSEAALRVFSVLGIAFASSTEKVQFRYARVRHPDGTTAVTSPDSALEQPEAVTREAPLYSDLKQEQLPIKSLGVGDTLEWQVHIERFQPEAKDGFWGQESLLAGAVVLRQTFELRVPAAAQVKVWTNPRSHLQPAVSTAANQRVYRWEEASLEPTVGPQAEAAAKVKAKQPLTPEEELDLREGKLPDIAWTSFPDWPSVGSWYRSLEGNRTEPDAAVKARVAELTAGKATLRDKVEAVYAFVSGHVRYVGIDLGVGRYQPHPAAEVLENGYGDCKDKHTLLAAMLTALGLQPRAVLIGSGIRFNADVPSPGSFNHLITQVGVDGKPVWLDSTEEVAPYRMLFAALRDRPALVVPETGLATVEHTPADPPFPTFERMTAAGAIDKEGVSESHFTLTERGDEELLTRAVLRQVTAAQYDQFAGNIVGNLGFSGTVSHAKFLHAEDPSQPLVMEWDYHREQAGNDWGNLRTVPQLMMVLLPSVDEKNPPTGAVQLLGARSVTSTSELKLPEGWSAAPPDAVHAVSEFGTYDMTFRYEKGTLYAERKWSLLKGEIPQSKWKQYKAWTDAIGLGNESYVQLRAGSGEAVKLPQEMTSATAAAPKVTAAQLVDDASAAIREMQFDQATTLLDSARTLDATQRNLWGGYAAIALHRGDRPEALRLYAKELQLHPESTWVYPALSQLQAAAGEQGAAIATLRRFVTQSPGDPQAATALIAALRGAGRDDEAAAEADAAFARLPEDARKQPRFRIVAAGAQMRGGEEQKGAEDLVTLLHASTDLLILNDTAYELADARQQLPLAEATERDVLAKLAAQSSAGTLDDPLPTLRARTSLTLAAWDTMGWILFREGKPQEAEPYIKAAWLGGGHAEVGQHLGDVQAALGRRAEALQTYGLALATVPLIRNARDGTPIATARRLELTERITKEGGSPQEAASPAQQSELGSMRTLPLSGALTGDVVLPYRLLLSAEGVRHLRPEDPKARIPPGAEALMQAAKLPPGSFPPGSQAVLMRSATLHCHTGHCEVLVHP